jgi:hypothetical protein
MIKFVHPKGTVRQIEPDTRIVRYMKLEVLLLMLKGWVFIPSYATLGKSDPLETNLLFDLPDQWDFWKNHADKIGSRLDSFVSKHFLEPTFSDITGGEREVVHRPSHAVEDVQKYSFPSYVNQLATQRCIWCWNEFRSFSNALWYLYGERGVAVVSTVWKVMTALSKAGVVRGIVAPIEYINHEDKKFSSALMDVENILSPYLLKSIAFDYEKEVRFILGASSFSHEQKGGVLIPIDASNFICEWRPSPHLQKEEQLVVRSIVDRLREPSEPPLDFSRRHESPFTHQDEYSFPDLL